MRTECSSTERIFSKLIIPGGTHQVGTREVRSFIQGHQKALSSRSSDSGVNHFDLIYDSQRLEESIFGCVRNSLDTLSKIQSPGPAVKEGLEALNHLQEELLKLTNKDAVSSLDVGDPSETESSENNTPGVSSAGL